MQSGYWAQQAEVKQRDSQVFMQRLLFHMHEDVLVHDDCSMYCGQLAMQMALVKFHVQLLSAVHAG